MKRTPVKRPNDQWKMTLGRGRGARKKDGAVDLTILRRERAHSGGFNRLAICALGCLQLSRQRSLCLET
jgi:hypothetical protein